MSDERRNYDKGPGARTDDTATGGVPFHTVITYAPVNRQTVTDALITAFEGGITYWCHMVRPLKDGKWIVPDDPGPLWYSKPAQFAELDWAIRIWFDAGGEHPEETKDITADALRHGFTLLAEKFPERFQRFLDPGAADAEDADVWFQLAAFGEVVYG